MLLYQGAKALEIWSGKPAPIEIMRRALEREVYGNR
jgi:shikimate dehydrogenase